MDDDEKHKSFPLMRRPPSAVEKAARELKSPSLKGGPSSPKLPPDNPPPSRSVTMQPAVLNQKTFRRKRKITKSFRISVLSGSV
jgi:hypothetical protein